MKRSAQKFPAALLHRTLDRLGAENLPGKYSLFLKLNSNYVLELDACTVGDLKGHITKFLVVGLDHNEIVHKFWIYRELVF